MIFHFCMSNFNLLKYKLLCIFIVPTCKAIHTDTAQGLAIDYRDSNKQALNITSSGRLVIYTEATFRCLNPFNELIGTPSLKCLPEEDHQWIAKWNGETPKCRNNSINFLFVIKDYINSFHSRIYRAYLWSHIYWSWQWISYEDQAQSVRL